MTKRSFFKSLMGAVAAVAMAPEIAFGVKLALPKHDDSWRWLISDYEWKVLKFAEDGRAVEEGVIAIRMSGWPKP